ncbi:Golgin family A protein [Quillaja saponaria]|uniref:Golgin family A protein n=1 Tax=Quillaja saponaria TaxID=32244 RepID=A0AAD7PDW6_QUISA|nr:Golgin family A protein [Quillaja saponaria]
MANSSMNLFYFQTNISFNSLTHSSRAFLPITCSFKRKPLAASTTPRRQTIPARDRIIDFGKYKGKMLGTLPSSYLKWVSKSLRARDFEEWAKLAHEVLQDPIYTDHIEWEFAENLLSGNQLKTLSSSRDNDEKIGAVSELMEISDRFGWDNEDKFGWSKIKFELLGTSKGGRIPRVDSKNREAERDMGMGNKKEERVKILSGGEEERRRRERRARLRPVIDPVKDGNKAGIKEKSRGSFVNGVDSDGTSDDKDRTVEDYNPFPGREALLRKVLNRKRFF